MKNILLVLVLGLVCQSSFSQSNSGKTKTLYDFKAKTIDGKLLDFSTFKGRKLMIVNTASKCGFTKQYDELQELYDMFQDSGFVIVAFPANNFMNQEPGTNEEIKEFCSSKFNVSFILMEKISVKGKDIHPIYSWLTKKDENGVLDASVKWNFQKFLIDENGKPVMSLGSKKSPLSETIMNWVEGK